MSSDVVLKWVGGDDPNGAFVGGVPAADLTIEQVKPENLPPGWTIDSLIGTGLYKHAGTNAARDAIEAEQKAAAEAAAQAAEAAAAAVNGETPATSPASSEADDAAQNGGE